MGGVDFLCPQELPNRLRGELGERREITIGRPPSGLHVAQFLDNFRPAGMSVAGLLLLFLLAVQPVASGQFADEFITRELRDGFHTG
ncbi:MAG: hypothetical protein ACRDTD_00410 [Pseudonocardiaceae bacterium]